ncbi:MAG: hypothetical protein M1828_003631 [Chrysothrix sp. TS-e1954]|nr:MAG: hypothetical protein M1828_003631 [Chrysothrix sp. TS-e1954]
MPSPPNPLIHPNLQIPPSQTLLLLIDIQRAFQTSPSTFAASPSSADSISTKIPRLLSLFRSLRSSSSGNSNGTDTPTPLDKPGGALIIHIAHHSPHPRSPLHPSHPAAGVEFSDFARPEQGETVVVKHVNSAFIGTGLEGLIRGLGVRRLVVAGLTTGHCVGTTVRMASNLGVVGRGGYGAPGGCGRGEEGEGGEKEQEMLGQIILVEDACATGELRERGVGRVIADPALAHKMQVETLRGEFCDVLTVEEVVALLERDAKGF